MRPVPTSAKYLCVSAEARPMYCQRLVSEIIIGYLGPIGFRAGDHPAHRQRGSGLGAVRHLVRGDAAAQVARAGEAAGAAGQLQVALVVADAALLDVLGAGV